MLIGVPKEIKAQEYRVGITPSGVKSLVDDGHSVCIESNAGTAIGYCNEQYEAAGAKIVNDAKEVYDCPMIVKVKEPQLSEYSLLKENQVLFTYLHLAPDPQQTEALLKKKVIGIAYETITDNNTSLPLLVPMSEVAGRLSIQAGATALQMINGGNGTLLGGVPGVSPANVVVVGGGVVGVHASRMALGLGASVTVLDNNLNRLRYLDDVFGPNLKTRFADSEALHQLTQSADLVIGAVLIPGKQAPKLINHEMINNMKSGSALVDVAIDQGGCAETSRATTHESPTYIVDDVVHYCVANMPGACARTSTQALTNATIYYVRELANKGYVQAMQEHSGLANGLNVYKGRVTYQAVADDLGYEYYPVEEALAEQSVFQRRAG